MGTCGSTRAYDERMAIYTLERDIVLWLSERHEDVCECLGVCIDWPGGKILPTVDVDD